ncbi:MAG: sigma 54-interacting transcriptional regulator, partial [Syntrophaceae bacterium]|nr:sigma 54-interacting transcriptional regulator [Syntrophaceae bacterium]
VEKLAKQGVEAFIGGQAVMNAAKEHHVAGLLLETSDESLREAIQEAAEALKLQLEEQEKTEILRSILDSVYDGIISVDANEHVTVFNSKAEILTGIKREEIINRKIGSMLPEMEIEKIIKNGKSELGSFKQIGNTSLVFNKLPIIVNNHIRGVVTTFQETKNIQRIENQLRRKLLHKGYIAKTTFDEIIGKSDIMKKTILRAQKFSAVDSTVLITGETGTGKELFAQSIHRAGKRANKPFLAVNCAALPESLLESELFGYVDGAFTGAKKEGKPGLFELAHSGTIFLDEISEMSLSVQARFLRVLQEKEVTRIGDDGMIAVDIRIIAATNKRLLSLVEEDKFREDLYHRLVVLPLHIPPLRERKEDIRDIANAYLHEKSADLGKPLTVISPEDLDLLMLYHWPGNVRQLLNVLERAIILCDGPELDRGNIVEALGDLDLDRNDKRDDKKGCGILKDLQEEAIRQALLQSNGNKSEAARKLGINAATLWRKLKKFDGY